MDLGQLTEESELFTPLKGQLSFQVAEDEDVLTKIPHGLTAKRNRRKSYHIEGGSNSGFSFSPLRVPLTAPRPNVLNSRAIGTLDATKRSLMSQLDSMRDGKENTPLRAKTMTPIKIDEIDITQYSSPGRMYQKRRSSTLKDVDDNTVTKIQKINKLFAEADTEDDEIMLVGNRTEETDGTHDDEELSRIELGAQEDIEELDSSVLISTQEDPNQLDQDVSLNPPTPSRTTALAPVAASPNTTQYARVVDEADLLLDTTRPVIEDEFFETQSPIPTAAIEIQTLKFVENIKEFEDVPVSPHKKHTHMASPNKKPYFTISQVHEIQEDFKNEVDNLKKSLKNKSGLVLELNGEISQLKNGIYELEDEVKSLTLEKKQLTTENDLLQAEHGIFKQNVSTLEETIQQQDEKIERHKLVIGKFKDRLKELNSIILSKDQEIEELKTELESKGRVIELLNQRTADFERQAQTLSSTLHDTQDKLANAESFVIQHKAEKEGLAESISSKEEEEKNLATLLEKSQRLLKESSEENAILHSQFNTEEKHLEEVEVKHSKLIEKVQSLECEIQNLQSSIGQERASFDSQVQKLRDTITAQGKELTLKTIIADGLQSAVNTMKISYSESRVEAGLKSTELKQTRSELAEARDLLIVKTAEVDELTIELRECGKLLQDTNEVVQTYERQSEELMAKVGQLGDVIKKKDQEVRGMREDLQKQETDHLTELEAFHAELSNVQAIASSKSNDLFKLNDEKEQFQRKYDLLKYEYDTMKEEAADHGTRVVTLKTKLHEYKEHAQNLENLVKAIEDEKAQIEKDTDKRLQQLAEDLYIQYSKKHEQKVQVLKKGYESKWQAKVSKAEVENERLRSEIEGLKAQLEKEKLEKNEIIKLWDKFKEAESTGA
jgi:kinetochore protein SLK19